MCKVALIVTIAARECDPSPPWPCLQAKAREAEMRAIALAEEEERSRREV